MDSIQPLKDFDYFVVFGCAHGFADEQAVLGNGSPGDAGGLGWWNGREGLVAAEKSDQA